LDVLAILAVTLKVHVVFPRQQEFPFPMRTVGRTLLEGPFYDVAKNEFRFVDIWDHKLYRLDLAKGVIGVYFFFFFLFSCSVTGWGE
jgi:hypothetical protein